MKTHILIVLFILATHAATVKQLLGTLEALQCYENGNDVRCKNLQTGKDWKVFTRSGSTIERWMGAIDREGTRLTCTDGDKGIVINLDGTNKQTITTSACGHVSFWRDASNNDWIIYMGEKVNKGQTGTTWKVKINKSDNKPVESTRKKIVNYQYHAGMNGTGTYLGTTYRNAYIYNIETGIKSPHLNDAQNCVGTINPGKEPWLFYEKDPAHHDVVISEWNEKDGTARYIWQYYSSHTIFGQWSCTDNRYAVVTKEDDLFLLTIKVDVSGTGDNKGTTEEAAMGLKKYVGRLWVEPSASANKYLHNQSLRIKYHRDLPSNLYGANGALVRIIAPASDAFKSSRVSAGLYLSNNIIYRKLRDGDLMP